jgi:hypothetical protein
MVVAACATEVQVKPVPGAESIVAEAPVHKVGDEWRYTGGALFQVVGPGQIKWSKADPFFFVDSAGRPAPSRCVAAGFKLLDFHLRVGKEWSHESLICDHAGTLRPYFNKFKVEAYEEVIVKAGTFKAFRISWYQEPRAPGVSGSVRLNMWWSPEVRGLVKRSGQWMRDFELESYSLK